MKDVTDTIAAVATPPGRGGVGIVRVSGPLALTIAEKITKKSSLKPRTAYYTSFWGECEVIDEGLALYFKGPNSFTGEDVVELQGHGGPVIMDMLLTRTLDFGARLARPGEFSERAFLNNKLDLAQAEAVADVIDATTTTAAQAAVRSLQGAFSKEIHILLEKMIQLRLYVEAAIDFPEEEIDFLSDDHVRCGLDSLLQSLQHVFSSAKQGSLLAEGGKLVILGPPNAGKSSLMNELTEQETAIVTDIPGTTRDTLQSQIVV